MSIDIDVTLPAGRYPVRIGAGLLDQPELLRSALPGRHVLVVSDSHVAPLYMQRVTRVLEGLTVHTHVLPAGEQHKTLGEWQAVIEALATMGASRDAAIVALGGGVVGDMAGFAAATWMRGIGLVQIPTSLLAMVDSSVGGKTAVDLPQGKNLVGAFHQPSLVLADTATLSTLPDRELRAGLAEVAKYAALGDAGFFGWLEDTAGPLLQRHDAALAHAIATSVRHKAAIVARDEREAGERALLNFGHTFGHAIEAEQGFGGLVHGEAVAVGMVLAARLSARLGLAPVHDAARLEALLAALGLPTARPEGLSAPALLDRMRLDKKAVSGQLRLVLWRGIGQAFVATGVEAGDVLAVLGD